MFPLHNFPAIFPLSAPSQVPLAAHPSLGCFPPGRTHSAAPARAPWNSPGKELSPQWAVPRGQLPQWLAAGVPSPLGPHSRALCPAHKRAGAAPCTLEKRRSPWQLGTALARQEDCARNLIFFPPLQKMLLFLTKGLFEV